MTSKFRHRKHFYSAESRDFAVVCERVAARLKELDSPKFIGKFNLDADPVMAERF
jgi:hypothetical protein